jgi:putative salt-induced outer membrane protein YdiY
MFKIFVLFLIFNSLLFASSMQDIEEQLAQAIKEQKKLNSKIALLKSKLHQDKRKDDFITHTELGYSKTGGNTDTQTFNLDFKIKKRWAKHNSEFHIDAQYAQNGDKQTKNKYILELEYNYDLTSRLSFNYITGYKNDKFSSYDYQFYTGPGFSYKVIKKEKHKLSIDTNIMFSQDKEELIREYISFMSKAIYSWQILNNLDFEQTLSYRTEVKDNDNYFIYSKSAIKTKLSKIFSTSISYKYDYVNILTTNQSHKDDTISINLIADY